MALTSTPMRLGMCGFVGGGRHLDLPSPVPNVGGDVCTICCSVTGPLQTVQRVEISRREKEKRREGCFLR